MPRLASTVTAVQSPSRLVLSLFLLLTTLSTLSTALPAPAQPLIYRGGRGGGLPVSVSTSRLARRAEQPHEVAGHARWNLGLHGDELVKRQAMANPAVVNAKATQVTAPVAATPVVAAPVATTSTAASLASSSVQRSLPTLSSSASSIVLSSSASTTVSSASTAPSSASSSSSTASPSANPSASLATSSTSSSSSIVPTSSATSTQSSQASSSPASTASADNASRPASSSGNIFSTSNRLFAVGLVVIIAIVVVGLLALMYVVKRVSHLPRFADARDYPHQPAYGGILPLMRGSTDLEKTLSGVSDSSRRGLLYAPATPSAGTAGATTGSGGPTMGENEKFAAPAPWTTFSSPTGTPLSGAVPAPPTIPPKAVPRLMSTISETLEPPSRTPSPVERPIVSSETATSSEPGTTSTITAAGRAKVVNPESYPRQHGLAPVPAPRYKWSPPAGKESGLRWQV